MPKIVLVIIILISNNLYACSCPASFEQILSESSYVFHVKILESLHDPDAKMDREQYEKLSKKDQEIEKKYIDHAKVVIADVINNIKGETVTNTIIIKNAKCPGSIFIQDLILENEYIFSLQKESETITNLYNKKFNRNGDVFLLHPCAEPAALLENNKVFYYKYCLLGYGCLDGSEEGEDPKYFMDYEDFIEKYGI
jgi:hypothetical protein